VKGIYHYKVTMVIVGWNISVRDNCISQWSFDFLSFILKKLTREVKSRFKRQIVAQRVTAYRFYSWLLLLMI